MHFELYSDIKSYPSTGVVKHPKDWLHGGYVEIQNPPSHYAIINLPARAMLCGFKSIKSPQDAHWKWIETALKEKTRQREPFGQIALPSVVMVLLQRFTRDWVCWNTVVQVKLRGRVLF